MRAFSASALLTAWLATGCAATESKACTMLGCVDGFDVAFPDQPSAAGTWSVVVKTPKDTRTCTVKVPFAGIDPGVVCSGDLQLNTSGSALAASQHRISGVHLADTPTQVTVTVQRDGAKVAEQAFAPAYKSSTPNGPGCGPTCSNASRWWTSTPPLSSL